MTNYVPHVAHLDCDINITIMVNQNNENLKHHLNHFTNHVGE